MFEHTVEHKSVDRLVTRYEAPEMPAKVLNVLTLKDVVEEILSDRLVFRLMKAIGSSWTRVKDRAIVRQFIKTKHICTYPVRLHIPKYHGAQESLVYRIAEIK